MTQTILIAALTLLSIMVTMPSLPVAVECHHFTPANWDPITPIAFRFPNSVAAVPTVSFGL